MLLINPYIFPGIVKKHHDLVSLKEYIDSLDIIGGRYRHKSYKRMAIAMILRQYTNLSFPEIGRLLHIDHAMVIYSCRKVKESIDGYNPELSEYYNQTRIELYNKGII